MSSIGVGELRGRLAAEDLSSSQYRFGVLNSSNKIAACSAITDKAYGVLQNDAVTSGLEASMKVMGESYIEAAEALAVGNFVGPSLNGRGQVAVATQYPRGICTFAASQAGELAVIELFHHADDLGGTETFVAAAISGTLSVGDDLTIADEADIILSAVTGSMLPKATTQKLGFWGTTPVDQPAHIADPAACAAATQGTYTSSTTLTNPPTKAEAEAELGLIDAELDKVKVDVAACITAIGLNNAAIDSINALLAETGLSASS